MARFTHDVVKIQTLMDQHRIMTIATLGPDGWPQATTVGYANSVNHIKVRVLLPK